MRRSRKFLVAVLGLGVIGAIGSAGTFAFFTTSASNPANTFSSGSLLITDVTSFAAAGGTLNPTGTVASAPNQSGSDGRVLAECSTAVVAAQCSTLIKSVSVAAAGVAPGQYLQGSITVANAGSLPATIALQVQNLRTNDGNGSNVSGAAGVQPCAADATGAGAPGATGPQISTGATTSTSYAGAIVPLAGCLDLGRALRITVQDGGGNGTGPQCVFGNDLNGGLNGNDTLQAPKSGAFGAGGVTYTAYSATGVPAGSGSGTCDDLSQSNTLGRPNLPVAPGSNPKDTFGTQSDAPSNASFAGISGAAALVFIPGGSTSRSAVNTSTLGGNLQAVPQWAASESHTFTITIALPNTGQTLLTDHNQDTYNVSNDGLYQGGAVSFDLYWLAVQ